MPDDVRNQAEVLARALEVGAATVADAVAWADAVIEAEDHPHWAVCDVAMMGASYPQDLVHALRQIPGGIDEDWVRAALIRRLAQGLAADRSAADHIARSLYQLADDLPEGELRSLAWWAWDALDLADQGMIEHTRDQVIGEMLAALNEAADQPRRGATSW